MTVGVKEVLGGVVSNRDARGISFRICVSKHLHDLVSTACDITSFHRSSLSNHQAAGNLHNCGESAATTACCHSSAATAGAANYPWLLRRHETEVLVSVCGDVRVEALVLEKWLVQLMREPASATGSHASLLSVIGGVELDHAGDKWRDDSQGVAELRAGGACSLRAPPVVLRATTDDERTVAFQIHRQPGSCPARRCRGPVWPC